MISLEKVLEVIGAVAATATIIAPFIPRGSALGGWVAWVATMPIGHHPKKEPESKGQESSK